MESELKQEGRVTPISYTRKADTDALVTNGVVTSQEDSFVGMYCHSGGDASSIAILEPPYKPATLYAIMGQNNTLPQCVEAMEVNIDGTGHTIALNSGGKENETEKAFIEEFFKEPYPGVSMVAIRRACRRDLEATGNGYLQVIRNAADKILMLSHIDCIGIRLIRLDDPVPAEKEIIRDAKPLKVTVRTRERRFVQLINGKKVYFKEFQASRDLDRETGEWAIEGKRLPMNKRASELIHFVGNKAPNTPYGEPRWISQLPSALGSRKAEEFNLDYFDSGGLPPVMVFIQGGTLGKDGRAELEAHLSGKKGSNHRAAVVEAVSTSGSLDSSGSVQVRVERFGGDRLSDAMFQSYDKACEEHIRIAFRLPPLFIGRAEDYSFASAYTSYMIAEEQVFSPERVEFDTVMDKIIKELGATQYHFRSSPVTLADVTNQLKALGMVTEAGTVEPESIVRALGEVTGLDLDFKKPEAAPPLSSPTLTPSAPSKGSSAPSFTAPETIPTPTTKDEKMQLIARLEGLASSSGALTESQRLSAHKSLQDLDEGEQSQVAALLASRQFGESGMGMDELCGCAIHLLRTPGHVL